MVSTVQAVARQVELALSCARLEECEYFFSKLQSKLQIPFPAKQADQ